MATQSPTITDVTMADTTTHPRDLKTHACLSCQSRKVKCDRKDPCSTCKKTSATCIFRPPAPPRRRKRRTTEEVLQARLRQYEEIFQEMGVKVASEDMQNIKIISTKRSGNQNEDEDSYMEPVDTSSRGSQSPTVDGSKNRQTSDIYRARYNKQTGRFYSGGGKSRYLESYLWTTVGDEIQDSSEVLGTAQPFQYKATLSHNWQIGGTDIFFGINTQNIDLRSQHPSFTVFQELWEKFRANIDPVVKVVHIPTLEVQLFKAFDDLDSVGKELETLMFAIYAITTTSITESECEKILRESKSSALSKYFDATRQSLVRTSFLQSSSMTVLQALTMFLFAIRPYYDSRSLWTLAGLAVRVGQGMGLHRDGALLNIPFFETEMRRRLWWQIVILDSIATHTTGAGTSILSTTWDVKLPLNLNDADLYPNMGDAPEERLGATEMIFCLLRYNFGLFLRKHNPANMLDTSFSKLSDQGKTIAQKNRDIDDYEKWVQDKFIKYCDPLDPLEFFVSAVARCSLAQMRLIMNHSHNMDRNTGSDRLLDKDALVELSIRIIEYTGLMFSSKSTQRYMWHICQHFPWHALVYLLVELRHCEPTRQADRAWEQVFTVYEHKPELLIYSQHPLHKAVCNLTLKAWESGNGSQNKQNLPPRPIPPVIQELHARRAAIRSVPVPMNTHSSTDASSASSSHRDTIVQQGQTSINSLNTTTDMTLTPESLNSDETVDWSAWDELFNLEFRSATDMLQSHLPCDA